jgi:predicted  nucleic acid-binding Zn-ribbon protein
MQTKEQTKMPELKARFKTLIDEINRLESHLEELSNKEGGYEEFIASLEQEVVIHWTLSAELKAELVSKEAYDETLESIKALMPAYTIRRD